MYFPEIDSSQGIYYRHDYIRFSALYLANTPIIRTRPTRELAREPNNIEDEGLRLRTCCSKRHCSPLAAYAQNLTHKPAILIEDFSWVFVVLVESLPEALQVLNLDSVSPFIVSHDDGGRHLPPSCTFLCGPSAGPHSSGALRFRCQVFLCRGVMMPSCEHEHER